MSINRMSINLIPRAVGCRGVERGPRGARITRQASGAAAASSTSVVWVTDAASRIVERTEQ